MPTAVVDTIDTPYSDSLSSIPQSVVDTPFVPHYANGMIDSVDGNDTIVEHVAELSVMEQLPHQSAQSIATSPLHSTGAMALLLTSIVAVIMSYRTGYKYIENLAHYMFSIRQRENLFEDHTFNETQILGALIVNTCIAEGFMLYYAVMELHPSLCGLLQAHMALCIGGLSVLALVFYLLQLMAYRLLGYVFADSISTKLWIDGFRATQSTLGLTLLPVLVILLLYPSHHFVLLTIGASLYLLARMVFMCKGFRIFYSNLPSILYFILYLCAVEIVPIALFWRLTIWLCGNLQS